MLVHLSLVGGCWEGGCACEFGTGIAGVLAHMKLAGGWLVTCGGWAGVLAHLSLVGGSSWAGGSARAPGGLAGGCACAPGMGEWLLGGRVCPRIWDGCCGCAHSPGVGRRVWLDICGEWAGVRAHLSWWVVGGWAGVLALLGIGGRVCLRT